MTMMEDSLSAESLSLSDEIEDGSCSGVPMKRDPTDYVFNILILGDSGVGKTDLIGRLGQEDFKTKFHATIGINVESRTLEVDGKLSRLQIWDPSGSDRFRTVIRNYFGKAEGVMFVYDVNYRKSFQNIKVWIQEIEENLRLDIPKILIGNKCDVPVNIERRVNRIEAEEFARLHRLKFLETSSITGENVQRAFLTLCQEMKSH